MKLISCLNQDPLLINPSWTKIVLGPNDTEVKVINKLKSLDFVSSLAKIEIEFPLNWQKLPSILTDLKFSPILNSFIFKTNQINFPEPQLSSSSPPFSDLLPLLQQQADYHHSLFPKYYKDSHSIDWPSYQQLLKKELSSPNSIHFFAYNQNQLVGFIQGQKSDTQAIIWELMVDSQFRGLKFGTQLLQQFAIATKTAGINKIEVETGHNQPAQKLYLNLGFVPSTQSWYKITTSAQK